MHLLCAPWHHLNVGTLSTTRLGGVSSTPFDSLNLGLHVNDNTQHVLHNRDLVSKYLPAPAIWLNQIHSAKVIQVTTQFDSTLTHNGDALYTQLSNQPLAIMTADCLPILLTSDCASEVAAIHGGWRGLEQGIIANTLSCFNCAPSKILAWLGPAIGAKKFEVGHEVVELFCNKHAQFNTAFKSTNKPAKYLADIYQLARIELNLLGITNVSGGEYCTVTDDSLFFSYRREGNTGRMGSVIWRN
ncbi:peptidoglycan editing factor PgeF [Pseudoalteromonas sp. MMG010]|uniref:peptidoglycan editing factor PgeF n=1 Tax=Pseudoalteromonas sp. MMG010 TaxID=2822685 RepID=UPI001B3A697C|nr:peptidoglycan editing factor PgeF [Pseudoalteromonas sp. MMG010]MBQ4833053.1 peptidoglycan editing factor PgeF [Pseudoalteromonas sp. MMG010]